MVGFESNEITLDVTFNETDYISADEDYPDVFVITFHNTELYLAPYDITKSSITDGF